LREPFVCLLGEDPWHLVNELWTQCGLHCPPALQPLRCKRGLAFRGRRDEVPALDRGDKICLPLPGTGARRALPALVDRDRARVVGYADASRGVAVKEDPAGLEFNHGCHSKRRLLGFVAFRDGLPFAASLPGEIGGRAQQGPQIVDGPLSFD
jgi:hypothetical protein